VHPPCAAQGFPICRQVFMTVLWQHFSFCVWLAIEAVNVLQTAGTTPNEHIVDPSPVPSFYHTSLELRHLISEMASPGPGACPGMNLTRAVFSRSPDNLLVRELRGRAAVSAVDVGSSQDQNVVDLLHVQSGLGPKPLRFALAFGEHGRELISVEVGMHLLKALCGREDVEEGLLRWAQEVLVYTEFLILPNVDESGRTRTEAGKECMRTNFNYVDLNRNWGYKWTMSEDRDVGAAPFSEPETEIARRHLEAFKPHAFLSVHSGDRALWTPGAYAFNSSAARKQVGKVWDALLHVAEQVKDLTHCNCSVGAPGKVAHKKHPGTSLDYVGLKMGVHYSMAWEIWYGRSVDKADTCIPHFSPQTERDYRKVLQHWTRAMLYYASSVHRLLKGLPLAPAKTLDAAHAAASRLPRSQLPQLQRAARHFNMTHHSPAQSRNPRQSENDLNEEVTWRRSAASERRYQQGGQLRRASPAHAEELLRGRRAERSRWAALQENWVNASAAMVILLCITACIFLGAKSLKVSKFS